MATTFKITVTAGFDGLTAAPAGARFTKVGPQTYALKSSAGSDLATVGLVPFALVLATGLSTFTTAFIPALAHDGGGSATTFVATVGVVVGGSFAPLYPSRESNPSSDGRAGATAFFTRDEVLSLQSNGVGTQTVIFTYLAGDAELEIDQTAAALSTSSSSSPRSIIPWAPLMTAAGELVANTITPYSVAGGDFAATMPAAALQNDVVGIVESVVNAGTLTLDAGPGRTIVDTVTGVAGATCAITGASGGGPRTIYFQLDGTVWRMSIANPFIV